jgi:hypothetical protein
VSEPYIEQSDNVYVIAGTRVSLDSIVYAFLDGQSAEAIAQGISGSDTRAGVRRDYLYLAHQERRGPIPRAAPGGLRRRMTGRARCRPDGLPEARRREEAEPAHALNGDSLSADADLNQISVLAVRRVPAIEFNLWIKGNDRRFQPAEQWTNAGQPPRHGREAPINSRGLEIWCGRGDSNPHGIATASPSSWCVCQFRHFR